MRRLMLTTATLSIATSLATSCQKTVVIRPFDGTDFVFLEKGTNFVVPKRGAFLSDEYLKQALHAEVKR